MTPIAIRLSDEELAALDAAVKAGQFKNRSDALRTGLRMALAENREQAIIESYRQGYGKHPQEEWISADGLILADKTWEQWPEDEDL